MARKRAGGSDAGKHREWTSWVIPDTPDSLVMASSLVEEISIYKFPVEMRCSQILCWCLGRLGWWLGGRSGSWVSARVTGKMTASWTGRKVRSATFPFRNSITELRESVQLYVGSLVLKNCFSDWLTGVWISSLKVLEWVKFWTQNLCLVRTWKTYLQIIQDNSEGVHLPTNST